MSAGRPPDRSARDALRRGVRAGDEELSTGSWTPAAGHLRDQVNPDVLVDCGWGRLVFGQTFASHDALLEVLRDEAIGQRDICLYPRDPHVLVARAPQELFIDPSHTFRMRLHRYRPARETHTGVVVRALQSQADVAAMNRIVEAVGMIAAPAEVVWDNQHSRVFTYLVAEDADTGAVIGTVTGIDHVRAFDDPEGGTSLWSLAVDPQTARPGVGQVLVRALLERYQARGRAYLDLSVMWDNEPAIALYEKLGFERVAVFAVKRKNPVNEPLFAAPPVEALDALNPYARIVADEALRRGIGLEVLDAPGGYLELRHGGRVLRVRESLSELTSAVAMSWCDDKRVTRRLLTQAGIPVPRGRVATFDARDTALLDEVGALVVKPARGEQGVGVTVGVADAAALADACERARRTCPDVLLEERVEGQDLRVLVIDGAVVAAAVRRPAAVRGDGLHTVRELIETQSRRRAAATGGEAHIPLDDETTATVAEAGLALDEVLPDGRALVVRGTANLHTGGTLHDVTAELHPALARTAVDAAEVLALPVAGVDLLVPDPAGAEHVVLEVNERPGLANHEPHPTAQRYLDLLFPGTRGVPRPWAGPSPADGTVEHRP